MSVLVPGTAMTSSSNTSPLNNLSPHTQFLVYTALAGTSNLLLVIILVVGGIMIYYSVKKTQPTQTAGGVSAGGGIVILGVSLLAILASAIAFSIIAVQKYKLYKQSLTANTN